MLSIDGAPLGKKSPSKSEARELELGQIMKKIDQDEDVGSSEEDPNISPANGTVQNRHHYDGSGFQPEELMTVSPLKPPTNQSSRLQSTGHKTPTP